jgi:hypothetical protein
MEESRGFLEEGTGGRIDSHHSSLASQRPLISTRGLRAPGDHVCHDLDLGIVLISSFAPWGRFMTGDLSKRPLLGHRH